ncbi:MAG: 30S ribosomal protein S4 [Omnitrophica WOR_2 bacterium RIFCSPHIGHO2_02_FULL_68_15]|nr:MAG: 30S ribosomal protein S4 [Omnitrophica WOR_2 bacterium RIFCSPHIGHO2_02_FULL_68_15]
MARYTGPACRICRRQGLKLFLKGTKCTTEKCPFNKRGFPPGQHGKQRIKISDYGLRLREKQKVKQMYGVFERQFRRYFSVAVKTRGVTGEKLLQLLERRLDNTVFRLGFASSRAQARQLVLHGHMQVNGRTVTLPSFTVRPGQVLQAAGREDQLTRVRQTRDSLQDRAVPPWLDRAPDELKATVTAMPTRADVQFPIQEQLIVELYSK